MREVLGARGTDRISKRDLEVLEFVARYGVLPRDAVAVWAATAKTATHVRERRLRLAGLIEVQHPLEGVCPFLSATRSGLRLCLRDELPVARLLPYTLRHHDVCARLGARLERAGAQLLSERELRATERAWGKRVYSIQLRDERFHRPDLIRLGERPTAIEVELSRKGQGRLEEIVRVWRREVVAERFERVLYCCTSEVLPYVERAVERMKAVEQVKVELLPEEDLIATSHLA